MKKLGLFYIILASVLWGTSGLFVNNLAPYKITSIQMTFIRGLVSFACMGIFILFSNRKIIKTNFKEIPLFICSGCTFLLTSSCYFQSIQLTSISTAVVLMYTAPIFVMIYSTTFLGEKINLMKLIAVIGMFSGCCLVSGIIGGLKFDALGIMFGFLSGISYAIYNIITKVEMQREISPIKANFYCFLFSSILGMVVANPLAIIDCILQNPPVVISLSIGVGVFTCILPFFFYTISLQKIPVGTASSLGILEPMVATILSVLVLGEKLTLYSSIGIVLILVSSFLISKAKE